MLRLDGFEGPMDLLLDLAQRQKLDLARISILSLVDQYLDIVTEVRLELAADWLVMAAWLAWLKSRLLLPDAGPADEAELAAGALASRLLDLQAARAATGWLDAQPQLGRDVFPRGAPESFVAVDRTGVSATLPGLLRAYILARGRAAPYRPGRPAFWTLGDALARLTAMLGPRPAWTRLEEFLPRAEQPLQRRVALASTLLAGLELERDGRAELRQDRPFGVIHLRPA